MQKPNVNLGISARKKEYRILKYLHDNTSHKVSSDEGKEFFSCEDIIHGTKMYQGDFYCHSRDLIDIGLIELYMGPKAGIKMKISKQGIEFIRYYESVLN